MKASIKKISSVLGGIALLIFIFGAVNYLHQENIKLQFGEVELKSTEVRVKLLNQEYETLLEETNLESKENQEKIKKLEQEKLQLEKDLQAKKAEKARVAKKKAEAERVAKLQPKTAQASSVAVSGDKQSWLRASNIPESQWWAVDFIVSKESSWNPNARNASSGAGGLVQALPYSKTGCAWGDAVCQLNWQFNYVNARYGGYAGAVSFWRVNHWY